GRHKCLRSFGGSRLQREAGCPPPHQRRDSTCQNQRAADGDRVGDAETRCQRTQDQRAPRHHAHEALRVVRDHAAAEMLMRHHLGEVVRPAPRTHRPRERRTKTNPPPPTLGQKAKIDTPPPHPPPPPPPARTTAPSPRFATKKTRRPPPPPPRPTSGVPPPP